MGRIRRLQQQQDNRPTGPMILLCPLCQREIPPGQRDAHHLIPKSKGGKHTEFLHRICHRQIHALFSEIRLARQLNTVEALLEQAEIVRFVQWVRDKPNDFYLRTRKSQKPPNQHVTVFSHHD